jgi:hypothetical protein
MKKLELSQNINCYADFLFDAVALRNSCKAWNSNMDIVGKIIKASLSPWVRE